MAGLDTGENTALLPQKHHFQNEVDRPVEVDEGAAEERAEHLAHVRRHPRPRLRRRISFRSQFFLPFWKFFSR